MFQIYASALELSLQNIERDFELPKNSKNVEIAQLQITKTQLNGLIRPIDMRIESEPHDTII